MADETCPKLGGQLERLAALGDRFPITCQTRPPGPWTPATDLTGTASSAWPEIIDAYADTLGTTQRRIAASIALQHHGTRVAGLAIGSWALLGAVPSLSAEGLHVRFDQGRTTELWLPEPRRAEPSSPREPQLETLGRELFGHLRPVVDAVRRTAPLNTRRCWGNLAASCAGIFCALDRLVPPERTAEIRAHAAAFFAVPEWPVFGLVDWQVWGGPPSDGLCHERRTCCLIRDIPGKQPCESCSIRPPAERRAAWEASLRELRRPSAPSLPVASAPIHLPETT